MGVCSSSHDKPATKAPAESKQSKSDDPKSRASDSEAKNADASDLAGESSFLDILRGPRLVLPKNCILCNAEMTDWRWRCWDCNVDLCEPCTNKQNAHSYCLVSKDAVDGLRPASGPVIR